MAKAQELVAKSNDQISEGIEMFLEECQFFTMPFDTEEEMDTKEDADEGEVEKKVEGLEEELEQAGEELLPHFPPPHQ